MKHNYAKIADLRCGDTVKLDNGFSCMRGTKTVENSEEGLYVSCTQGKHFLAGQLADDGEFLVGIYKLTKKENRT